LQGSPACGGGQGRQSDDEPHKRGLNTKLHLAVDAHGMPLRAVITEGTRADCTQAIPLIQGFSAEQLLADRAYDSNEIVGQAAEQGMNAVIPPKKNRKVARDFNREIYKARHLIESVFLYLKQWCGIATRYTKNANSFLTAIHIRCIFLWATIS